MIKQLESHFSIAGKATFFEAYDGLPFLRIQTAKASALISIYAAQVLSYQPSHQDQDLLFMSDHAYFSPGKAIRGGIPICWPWFGAATISNHPAHGFVRNRDWSLTAVDEVDHGDIRITLTCQNDDQTRLLWDHSFELCLQITVGHSLTLALLTTNTGQNSFTITEALHSYFKVGDIHQVTVYGLEETEYLDKNQNFATLYQAGEIVFKQATDHIYPASQQPLIIADPVYHRKIQINTSGNNNVVIWNPWHQGASTLKDLNDNDYCYFICLESANVADHLIELKASEQHTLSCHYVVSSL